LGKIEHSIEVNVPLSTAYNQWTQFEDFPKFMTGIKAVRQIDDKTLEWTAKLLGREQSWMAEISEQVPDQRIAWHSTSGQPNSGMVSFQRMDDNTTRVTLELEWDPEGVLENVGDILGFDDRQVRGDLERFKESIEGRGEESGAWRGEINKTAAG
jgi:uncharacterized membrane protein